jgi:hypothetical protein
MKTVSVTMIALNPSHQKETWSDISRPTNPGSAIRPTHGKLDTFANWLTTDFRNCPDERSLINARKLPLSWFKKESIGGGII